MRQPPSARQWRQPSGCGAAGSSDILVFRRPLPVYIDARDAVFAVLAQEGVSRADGNAIDARHQDADVVTIAVRGAAGVPERDGLVVGELRVAQANGGAELLRA